MADPSSSGPGPSYDTYADYVASVYGVRYGGFAWLVGFLRKGYEVRFWEYQQPQIEIHVLDSVNDTLESWSFVAPRRGPVDQSFLNVLRKPPSERRTRLILLQCGQLGDTNGSYIDAIGLHYLLDPYFFSAHFDLCRDLTESGIIGRSYGPSALPSGRRFLQIVTDRKNSFMTATWRISSQERTFIVLGLDHSNPDRLTKLRDELLKDNSPIKTRIYDENPADYLFPYVRDSARAAASLCNRHAHFDADPDGIHGASPFTWQWNQSNRRALISSMNSLARFVAYPEIDTGVRPLKLRSLLPDYAALIKEAEVTGLDFQGLLQQRANSAAMEETKRGIAQADSVRRLALVAFVFIPLNFATSFFGMNFEQLGTGTLNIGYFFLLAALAGGLSLALSTTLKPIEAAWLQARYRFALREYQDNDKELVASITKRQIIWAFVRRHFPPARMVYESWEDAKYNSDNPDELPLFTTLYSIGCNGARSRARRLWNSGPFAAKPAADAPQDRPEA
ncbi:hypothetical protein FGG08_004410 [Glutinoglossum americanum]|uniref:Transmembrane protein n=1 Tax=Glutinoglossum americanum TaxID=1670608 RepID=A0A9P8I0G0_9PEZI|nr:hypothetical protein FGG08_004410 [Glutinoglossum americanum]